MVCVRMGLLDEAIREHLDLRRRGGADPGEVARQERDALSSVYEIAEPYDGSGEHAEGEPYAQEHVPTAEPAPAGEPEYAAEPPLDAGTYEEADRLALARQETAEIDMSALLGQDYPEYAAAAAAQRPGRVPAEDEPLEWEQPAAGAGAVRAQRMSAQIPGQESLHIE